MTQVSARALTSAMAGGGARPGTASTKAAGYGTRGPGGGAKSAAPALARRADDGATSVDLPETNVRVERTTRGSTPARDEETPPPAFLVGGSNPGERAARGLRPSPPALQYSQSAPTSADGKPVCRSG